MSLTNKEMLLALVNNMNERDCKKVYLAWSDIQSTTTRDYLYFDIDGNKIIGGTSGLVKLTTKQYYKLIYSWGQDKTKACISLLAKRLDSNDYASKASHYNMLNGWVEKYYYKLKRYGDIVNEDTSEEDVPFSEINSKEQASKFVSKIPEFLRATDTYVVW